jgi:hypothetical protein
MPTHALTGPPHWLSATVSALVLAALLGADMAPHEAFAADAAPAAADTLVAFRIKDQFDRLHTDARFRGMPLLVAWGDRAGNDFRKLWSPVLTDSLAEDVAGYRLKVVAAAHAKGVPFFVKGKIKGSFPKDRDQWVLVDWDGVLDAAYAPVPERCNLLLFGRDGRLLRRWDVAEPSPDDVAEVLAAVRAVIDGRAAP